MDQNLRRNRDVNLRASAVKLSRYLLILAETPAPKKMSWIRSRTRALAGGQREADGGAGGEDAGGVTGKGFK